MPPSSALLLDDEGREALVREREGRGDAGEPPADDQDRVVDAELAGFQGLEEFGLGDRHADQVLRLLGRLLGLVHVDPGILVPDVGHLEEVAVQARLLAVLLEEPLMGPGRAGGDDDPREPLLLDHLAHLDGRILGAGEEVVRGIDHVGQGLGVLHDGRDVDHAADVDPAVADEDPRPRADPPEVALHRELFRRGQRAPARGQEPLGAGGGAARLHDRLGDVLGAGEGAADEDPFPGGLDRVLPERLAEAVLLEVDAQVLRQLGRFLRRRESHGEDDHVELLLGEAFRPPGRR